MSRFLIMLAAMTALAVASRIYTQIVSPLTQIVSAKGPDFVSRDTDLRPPAFFEEQAIEAFPELKWTHQAEQNWQIAEHVTLYFREFERITETGNTLRIAPVAILWKDPQRPESSWYRIVAQQAQIKFEHQFFDSAISLTDAKPGRIVWASLEGTVHIDGPDGLKIDGQNFKFDEESLQLYSDMPIAFTYGPTPQDQRRIVGKSDALQLTFQPASESALGQDLPRVGGLAQVLLRRNVTLDMAFVQQGEPRQAHLNSAGPLQYDVLKREIAVDERVHAAHRAWRDGKAWMDTLSCEVLRVFLASTQPQTKLESSPGSAFDGLVFQSMRAQGSLGGKGTRLKVTSEEQDLTATMQDLSYDAVMRRAVLVDSDQVVVQRGHTTFQCPQIGLQHSETNGLEYLECRGPGQMEVMEAGLGPQPLTARWKSRVQVSPDPQAGVHQIRIEQNAQLSIPERFGIAADVLRLWVDMNRMPTGSAAASETGNTLSRPLPLKRARAEGRVRFDSAQLKVKRANLIDAVIQPGVIGEQQKSDDGLAALGSSNDKAASPDQQQEPAPWLVEADELHLNLIHDPLVSGIDLRTLKGTGGIVVTHEPDRPLSIGSQSASGPIMMTGSQLQVDNQGGYQQVLTLWGATNPQGELTNAEVSIGKTKLWGGQLTLSRNENRFDVPGPGGLSVPLPQSTAGTGPAVPSASGPQMLDIIWGEGMTFDGQAARFWGKITASVPSDEESISRLLCEDLTAELNQRLSFIDPQARTGELAIERITGRHHVTLEAFEIHQSKVLALRRALVSAFWIEQSTGNFHADGPGEIHSWSLGDQVKFSPGESPQANQPAKTQSAESKWRYSGLTFAGTIDGNMNQNEATFRERVRAITAPVDKPNVIFRENQLSEETPEAANAVWMKCKELRVLRIMQKGQQNGTLEVFASGETELEGHVFRAYADELTYDERGGQFVLRGLGRDATLYFQPEIGKPPRPSAARLIQFNPAKRDINVNGLTGLNASY